VTAGDVGFHYVVRALMEHGRPDVLHAMLARTDPPSYGAQVMAGATALTENWDPADGGSQNHFMLGHAEQWLFGGLAGISVDFARAGAPIVIAPQPVPDVDSAGGRYRSVLGLIVSRWRRQGAGLRVEVEIPAGASAEIRLPAAPGAIHESGGSILTSPDVKLVRDGKAFEIGSGRYLFETERL
jgi:hypothetical protein